MYSSSQSRLPIITTKMAGLGVYMREAKFIPQWHLIIMIKYRQIGRFSSIISSCIGYHSTQKRSNLKRTWKSLSKATSQELRTNGSQRRQNSWHLNRRKPGKNSRGNDLNNWGKSLSKNTILAVEKMIKKELSICFKILIRNMQIRSEKKLRR